MNTNDLIRRYTERRVSENGILPTTAPEVEERLRRIFRELESTHGVKMEDKIITGLDQWVLYDWYAAGKKRWKPATFNNYISILKPFLRWAAVMKVLPADYSPVLRTVRLPKADQLPESERPKDKHATHEQVKELLYGNHGRNQVRDRAIVALILSSSLRVSELCSITVEQYLAYKASMEKDPEAGITLRRKGGSYVNTAIGKEAIPLIDAYLATRDGPRPEEPLFMTTHGKPCSPNQVYKALSFKQKQLDLATGPHAVRHICISEVEKRGSASLARDTANHHSFAVTNIYTHTSVAERRAVLDALPWFTKV